MVQLHFLIQNSLIPILFCGVHCLGASLGPEVDRFSLPHLTVEVGSCNMSLAFKVLAGRTLMVGFSSSSVLGLLGTNFVNFLIPVYFLFIRSQPKFGGCATASLNQRAAVAYTRTRGSISPLLSVRFTELKPIQLG